MIFEVVVALAVLTLMLLCIGVPPETVFFLLFVIISGAVVLSIGFVILFFFITDISLLFFRKVSAEFLRIEEKERFDHAVYKVGAEEYACIFPAESVRRKKIYRNGTVTLMIPRIGKRKIAFDRHSLLIIALGSFFSLLLLVGCIWSLFMGGVL